MSQPRTTTTFGSAMSAHRGIGPGFDLLRVALALMIFAMHAKWAAGQGGVPLLDAVAAVPETAGGLVPGAIPAGAGRAGLLRPIQLALVPMFFALSGYLVMGSAARLRATSTFLAHRALRIFPALVVEVTLSALVLGPAFTVLPLDAYFGSGTFWTYFGNIVGHVSFTLPGVFLTNPAAGVVNVNLWTLPAEFHCYVITAACMAVGLLYRRALFTGLSVAAFAGAAIAHALTGMSAPTVPFPGHVIVLYFVGGVLFHHWQDRIPAHPALFAACLAASYAALASTATLYLAVAPLIYVTVYAGLIPVPRFRVLASGDYSYGVYLYGFPITQALVALAPATFTGHFLLLLAAALPPTLAFAVLSWHGIEKRALACKARLPERLFPSRRARRAFEREAAA